MHSFKKQFHPKDLSRLYNFSNVTDKVSITTLTYPFKQSHLPEILDAFKSKFSVDDQFILMYAENLADAEINILFQYHKICIGLKKTSDIFCDNNSHDIINWNKNYRHWKDMQDWELREWFSLFYVKWIQEWIDSQTQVPADWLKIRNVDFLNRPTESIDDIIKFCNLTSKSGIEEFFCEWKQKQQYVIDEMELINNIVKLTTEQTQFVWNPINVIAESIVQQKLRLAGYEIRCAGLNIFPTDTETLYNLLEKC
jgi:hypothetical protein